MPNVIDLAASMSKLGLEQRLRDLPSTAMVRGIFFRLLKDEVDKRGIGTFDELPRLLDLASSRSRVARDLIGALGEARRAEAQVDEARPRHLRAGHQL